MLVFFKAVIISVALSVCYIMLFRIRVVLFRRMLMGFMSLGICILIAFPELSTSIAHLFGIGRGVDFLFYIAHLLVIVVLVHQYQKQQDQDRKIVKLLREMAIRDAIEPKDS